MNRYDDVVYNELDLFKWFDHLMIFNFQYFFFAFEYFQIQSQSKTSTSNYFKRIYTYHSAIMWFVFIFFSVLSFATSYRTAQPDKYMHTKVVLCKSFPNRIHIKNPRQMKPCIHLPEQQIECYHGNQTKTVNKKAKYKISALHVDYSVVCDWLSLPKGLGALFYFGAKKKLFYFRMKCWVSWIFDWTSISLDLWFAECCDLVCNKNFELLAFEKNFFSQFLLYI